MQVSELARVYECMLCGGLFDCDCFVWEYKNFWRCFVNVLFALFAWHIVFSWLVTIVCNWRAMVCMVFCAGDGGGGVLSVVWWFKHK